jgi:hypothetical protein
MDLAIEIKLWKLALVTKIVKNVLSTSLTPLQILLISSKEIRIADGVTIHVCGVTIHLPHWEACNAIDIFRKSTNVAPRT